MRTPLSRATEFELEELHFAWVDNGRRGEHPWHLHSDLPAGTFGSGLTAVTHYELTTPIRWGAGEALHRLAANASDPDWASELAQLAAAGNAVLSWVEFLHPEETESGLLLVDPHH